MSSTTVRTGGPGSAPAGRSGNVLMVGNYGPTVALTRALGRSGYRVILGDGGEYATADRSRYCREVWQHPPASEGEAFMVALLGFLERRPEIDILMPLLPDYLELLSANRERVPKRITLAMPDAHTVETCLDKERMYQIALDAGVPYEPIAVVADLPSLRASAADVGFPCVIRPVRDTAPPLPNERKAIICRDAAGLDRAFGTWPGEHPELLVQRFASGPRHNVHFAARHGRVLARIQTMSLRTDRPDGTGLGVAGISVRSDPGLTGYLDALLERLHYTGIGLVQFMVPEHAEPSFLELNPRHGTAIAFIQHCGLDLANAAIELAAEASDWDAPPGFHYPIGKRYAWTSKDIYGLQLARARGEIGRGAAARWLARSLQAGARADVHLSWSLRDPMPTLAIYASLMRSGAGRG